MKLILISIISFSICYFLINSSLPLFNKYLLCSPNLRSSHKKPLPSGAGIIFSLISTIFSSLYGWYVPLVCFPISLIGFIDDRQSISKTVRYFSQIFTGLLLIFFSNGSILELLNFSNLNFFLYLSLIIFIVFIVTAIINFFNFMDGIDGLVASIFIFYLIYLCLTDSTNKIFLLTSLVAFLFFNWSPARIFMGDSGSTFIGAIYTGTLLEANSWHEFFFRVIIFTPLFGDAFITLIFRIVNKQNIFKAHKLHLYQRLNQGGMSHSQVALLYLTTSILICLIGIYNLKICTFFAFLALVFGFYLNKQKAVPFNKYY